MKNCDNRKGVVETTSTGAAQWGRGHTSFYIHNRGKQTPLENSGAQKSSFSTNYQGNKLFFPYSKGTQTLLSTARANKPFF
jgi:hypothetical protein